MTFFRFLKWLFSGLYLTVWGSVSKGTCWHAQCPEFNFHNPHGRRINPHKLSCNFQICVIAYIQPYSTHTYPHTHNNTNNNNILNVLCFPMLNIRFYFSFGSEIFVFLKIVIRLKPTLCLNIFPRHCLPILSDL